MKTGSSVCPLDQLSIIPFKKSAYLRSYLTTIIQTVRKSGQIPDTWRKAASILIHKKESTDDPQNFRPITRQSVSLISFTSTIRNAMYEFLSKNNYIENRIQKGFTPGMSGTFEHTAHLAYLIRRAKKKQRSLTIALLDLRNAFGEVHHKLIEAPFTLYRIAPERSDFHTGFGCCLHYATVIRYATRSKNHSALEVMRFWRVCLNIVAFICSLLQYFIAVVCFAF